MPVVSSTLESTSQQASDIACATPLIHHVVPPLTAVTKYVSPWLMSLAKCADPYMDAVVVTSTRRIHTMTEKAFERIDSLKQRIDSFIVHDEGEEAFRPRNIEHEINDVRAQMTQPCVCPETCGQPMPDDITSADHQSGSLTAWDFPLTKNQEFHAQNR